MKPKVIFEDNDILVLDKPAGMIVNRSDTTAGEKTVQEWVEGYVKVPRVVRVSRVPQGNSSVSPRDTRGTFDTRDTFIQRAGIVHRLDKETSGILLTAKTPQAFENLQKQFKERKVKKTYVALVHGRVEPSVGEINVPVGRLPWNRKRFGVLAGGREAVTKYKVLSSKYYKRHSGKRSASRISNVARDSGQARMTGEKEPLSLLELYPQTGRTHQIRVHLKYFNHPIFSDPLYTGRKTARNDRKLLPRIFLHATKISFNNPKTGQLISFESPLPKQLNQFLTTLNS